MEKWKVRCTGEYQEQVRSFVQREVIYCVSELVGELISKAESFDADTQEALYRLCSSYREDEETGEEELFEVFEHWIVTEWLGRKLKAKGEIVEEVLGLVVWGRTTTGQAIRIDDVVCDIYDDIFAESEKLSAS